MDRTPSDITVDLDSLRDLQQPLQVSHESLGYRIDRTNDGEYTLAKSPTPPDPSIGVARTRPFRELRETTRIVHSSPPPSAPQPSAGSPQSSPHRLSGIQSSQQRMPSTSNVGDISALSIADTSVDAGGDTAVILARAVELDRLTSRRPQLTSVPPQSASHRDYAEYAAELGDDPLLTYTQVLIWCTRRRIQLLETAPPKELTKSRLLELQFVLRTLEAQLISGKISVHPHTRSRTGEPPLKPQMPNLENVKMAGVLQDLLRYKDRLEEQTRSSAHAAKLADDQLALDATITTTPSRAGSEESYASVAREANSEYTNVMRSITLQLAQLDQLHAVGRETALETISQQRSLETMAEEFSSS